MSWTMHMVGLLSVLLSLSLIPLTSSSPHHFGILSSYSLYANEFQQAFQLSKQISSRYNASTYYAEQARCISSHNLSCSLALYQTYRPKLRIWRPIYDDKNFPNSVGRVEMDCRYTIDVLMQRHHISHFVENSWFTIEYQFVIQQGNCENWDLEQPLRSGGSTFDVAASNEYFTTACSVLDKNDGSYIVYCRYMFDFQYYSLTEMDTYRCLNITAILAYEHYDAYSEVLPDFQVSSAQAAGAPARYYSSRRVIADSKTFCFEPHQVHSHTQKLDARGNDSLSHSHMFSELFAKESNRRRNLTWYTCKWTNPAKRRVARNSSELAPPNDAFFGNKFYTGYKWKSATLGADMMSIANTLLASARHNERDSIPRTIPLTATLTKYNKNYEHELLYLNSHSYPRRYTVLTAKELKDTVPVSSLAIDAELYFLGDLHVSHLYEATAELVFGKDIAVTSSDPAPTGQSHSSTPPTTRKKKNINYLGSPLELATAIAENVLRVCKIPPGSPAIKSRKIIIHTGWNDLGVSSLRRYVESPNLGGSSLVDTVLRIVSGAISCPALTQVIWITTVPHAICFNDKRPKCNDNRGFRNNANIAAANEYVLQRLLRGTSKPGIKLTIVDAFSMISSRLMFNEDVEFECDNNFVCRVDDWGRDSNIIFTPGGQAVFDSLIHAISSIGSLNDLKYPVFKDWDPDEILAEYVKDSVKEKDQELREKKRKKMESNTTSGNLLTSKD